MRVAIHADAVGHAIPGGIGAYVECLVAEVLRDPQGVEVRLLVSRSTKTPDAWPPGLVERIRLPIEALYPAWNLVARPHVEEADVVHATAFVVPPCRGAAIVATLHDDTIDRSPELVPQPWRTLYRTGLRRALRHARVLCANSNATKKRFVDRYDIDPARIVVTPLAPVVVPDHARDDSIFARHSIRAPYVLSVGTLEPRKNHAALVRAFAAAALGTHQLVIAGADGWGADQVRKAIVGAGSTVSERIVLTGTVTGAELASLYAGADAFAFPSVYEGFGMPLAEALAFGIPSLASTDDALRELGGDAVVPADPSDGRALCEALESVCTDETLRDRLRQAAPRRAATLSWKKTYEGTLAAWRRAADER